jgi:hypothetical protein
VAIENPRVSIRMYRQGLGDCFLLTFPGKTKPFHMLIDCGVVLGTPKPEAMMGPVLDDILSVTKELDLLVVTHEHWDHVSGFAQVRDRFEKLGIKQVWVAWTEDPKDPLATKLRAERKTAENALRMAVARLAMSNDDRTAAHVDSLVGFLGATVGSTAEALNYAKTRAPGGPRYCQPGEPPIELSELPGIRFWVLGPPKNERLIKKSAPGVNEAYGLDASPGGSQALLIAGLMRGMAMGDGISDDPIEEPFDLTYSIPMARAEQLAFFQRRYFNTSTDGSLSDRPGGDGEPNGFVADQSWRRIDAAWMGASETMALQLDSATNNTSLVLGIELVESGEVLLFPGDAQAGNWLSWQDLKWEIGNGAQKAQVTGPDLLARTIFYKVGHHGSHNATLKDKGLELMAKDTLIAMIPVDHAMAVKKRWGRMPLPDLVNRIKDKTHGRVLRVDDAVETDADLDKLKPDQVSASDWSAFTRHVRATKLYYELVL